MTTETTNKNENIMRWAIYLAGMGFMFADGKMGTGFIAGFIGGLMCATAFPIIKWSD